MGTSSNAEAKKIRSIPGRKLKKKDAFHFTKDVLSKQQNRKMFCEIFQQFVLSFLTILIRKSFVCALCNFILVRPCHDYF